MLKTLVNKFSSGISVSAFCFRRAAYPVAIAIGAYPTSMYSAPSTVAEPPVLSKYSIDDDQYFSFKRPSLIVEGSIGASMMLLGSFKSGTVIGPNLGLMLATDNLIYDSNAFKMGFGMSLNGVYFRPSLVDKVKDETSKATKMKVKIDDKEKLFDCFDILKFPSIELSLSPMLIANAYINKTTYATLGIGPKFSYTKGIAAVKRSNIIKQTPSELVLSSQAGKALDAGKYNDYGIFSSGTAVRSDSKKSKIRFDIATKRPGRISGGKVDFKDAFGMIEGAPTSGKATRAGKQFNAIREALGELPGDEGVYHELSAGAKLDLGVVFAQTKALKLGLKLSYEADMPFYYRSNVKPFFTNTKGKIWLLKPNVGGISSAALNKIPAKLLQSTYESAYEPKVPLSERHITSNDYSDFFVGNEYRGFGYDNKSEHPTGALEAESVQDDMGSNVSAESVQDDMGSNVSAESVQDDMGSNVSAESVQDDIGSNYEDREDSSHEDDVFGVTQIAQIDHEDREDSSHEDDVFGVAKTAKIDPQPLFLQLKTGRVVPVTFMGNVPRVYNCSIKRCKGSSLERNYPSLMFENTSDVNAVLEDGYWLKRGSPSFVIDDNMSDDDLKKMMKVVKERKVIRKAIDKVYPFKSIGHKLTASITIGFKL